jgi:hypothetical protein
MSQSDKWLQQLSESYIKMNNQNFVSSLTEELKSEEQYSELLENVLFELLGPEDFTRLFEYVMQGSVTHDETGNPLSPERSARRAKRIAQIVDIGRKAGGYDKPLPPGASMDKGDDLKIHRAALSLVAKGVDVDDPKDSAPADVMGMKSSYANVLDALSKGSKLRAGQNPTKDFGYEDEDPREVADTRQKSLSADAKGARRWYNDRQKNTFN